MAKLVCGPCDCGVELVSDERSVLGDTVSALYCPECRTVHSTRWGTYDPDVVAAALERTGHLGAALKAMLECPVRFDTPVHPTVIEMGPDETRRFFDAWASAGRYPSEYVSELVVRFDENLHPGSRR